MSLAWAFIPSKGLQQMGVNTRIRDLCIHQTRVNKLSPRRSIHSCQNASISWLALCFPAGPVLQHSPPCLLHSPLPRILFSSHCPRLSCIFSQQSSMHASPAQPNQPRDHPAYAQTVNCATNASAHIEAWFRDATACSWLAPGAPRTPPMGLGMVSDPKPGIDSTQIDSDPNLQVPWSSHRDSAQEPEPAHGHSAAPRRLRRMVGPACSRSAGPGCVGDSESRIGPPGLSQHRQLCFGLQRGRAIPERPGARV
jgi:hypothetical protein